MMRAAIRIGIAAMIVTMVVGTVYAQNSPFQLTLFALSGDQTIEDSLSADVLGRLYAFNGTAGDTVTIRMTALDEALDTYVVLFGEAGGVMALNDDMNDDTYNSEILDYQLPYTGTYFILASSYGVIALRDGTSLNESLAFELALIGAQSLDEDALIEYFYGPLVIGDENVEGYSTPSEPVYYWLFNGQADQSVTVSMESTDFDTLLYLFDAEGNMLAINDNANGTNAAIEHFTLPHDSTYLVFATDLFYKFVVNSSSTLFEGGDFYISLEAE